MTHTTTQLIEWLDEIAHSLILCDSVKIERPYIYSITSIRAQLIAAQEMKKALEFCKDEMRYANWHQFNPSNISRKPCFDRTEKALTKATEAGIE